MKDDINCLVCSNNNWELLGKTQYLKSDVYWNDSEFLHRKHIFFDIWHNGASKVELKRFVCKNCGLVIDLPRPSDENISDKYNYMVENRKKVIKRSIESISSLKKEYKESLEIIKTIKSFFKKRKLEILDFGGRDGHMLSPMQKMGHKCYLVDYYKNPVIGVNRLGNNLDDIPENLKFDLIICRHVIEHLSDPRSQINKFKPFLKKDGLIYAVVPIDMINRKNPHKDPVTHINFFQEDSLRILFESAGFKTIFSKSKKSTYHGNFRITARLLAKIDKDVKVNYKGSYEKTFYYLKPNLLTKFKLYSFKSILKVLYIKNKNLIM